MMLKQNKTKQNRLRVNVARTLTISLLMASISLQANETVSLYVEDGIQVNKVIKRTPLGGEVVEYTKTRVDVSASAEQHKSLRLNTEKEVAEEEAASNYLPSELRKGKLVGFDAAFRNMDNHQLADLPPPVKPEKRFLVKTDSNEVKAEKLLERVKVSQSDNELSAVAEDLRLAPGEALVRPKPSIVVNKKPMKKNKGKKRKRPEDAVIKKLRFDAANILDVAMALADISGLNFVATEAASKKNVTVFLQNITVLGALETVTKNSGLWYRKDKNSNVYRIMTTQEYARDLVVYRDDITKVFQLLHPNPLLVASTIADLYGDRVILSYGMFDDTAMGSSNSARRSSGVGRSNNTRGRSNRGQRGRVNETVTQTKADLAATASSEQLANLKQDTETVGTQDAISADKLNAATAAQQPIYVTLNREQDLMIVRTSDVAAIKDIEALVKALDLPTKQVLLEMKILSLDIGDFYRRATDIDFMPNSESVRGPLTDQDRNPLFNQAPFNADLTETINTPNGTQTITQSGQFSLGVSHILGLGNFALEGGTFVYQFLSDKIRARIQLLQQNNRINTLSSPLLLTTNKKTARVFVGTEQIVTTGFEAVAGGTNGLVVGNPAIIPITEIRDIGNTLQVLPNINGDKTVTLLIKQDASSLIRGASTIPVPVGNSIQSFNVDSVRTSNIEGTVVAKDGLTIAIGGLIDATDSEDIQKVPVIGDFPIIGEFFKRKVKEKSKRELILLITPHIIESPHLSDDISRDVVEPLTEHEW